MSGIKAIVKLASLACLASQPVNATEVTDCDRLAAHNSDPDKTVAVGVSGKDILPAAIEACRDAIAAEPDNLRFRYQLARALAENGRAAEGHPDIKMAAAGGYRQAQFVLGYLYDEGMQGLPKDPCTAAQLWHGAANQGLMAALISFPHHVVRGHFASCRITVDQEALRFMLGRAQALGPDYYQRMIITDLLAELAAPNIPTEADSASTSN